MAWKPKTVVGKILKGVTIGAGAVGAGALLIGTAGAAIPAIGGVITAGKGIVGKVLQSSMKTVDAVSTKAADLVSGITKDQRALVAAEKDEADALSQKVTTVEKLIKAGSTVEKAASAVGLPLSSLAGMFGLAGAGVAAGVAASGYDDAATYAAGTVPITGTANSKMLTYGALGIAALFILPKILKR